MCDTRPPPKSTVRIGLKIKSEKGLGTELSVKVLDPIPLEFAPEKDERCQQGGPCLRQDGKDRGD